MADFTQTSANVRFGANAEIRQEPAAEAIDRGESIVKNASGRWEKANAGDADIESRTEFGMAVNDCVAAGQPLLVCLSDDDMTPGFTVAVGTPAYVSGANDGAWAPAADLITGNAIIPCMEPVSTTKVIFHTRPTGATVA